MNAASQGVGCGKNTELLRNNIHHNGSGRLTHGIYCNSENLLVDGNEVHHNTDYGIHIYKEGGTPGPNIVVRNNRAHHNGSAGILVAGIGTQVFNNIVWSNRGGIMVGYSAQRRDVRVFNNTAYGNADWGINVTNAPGTELINNIVFMNGKPIVIVGNQPIQSNNLTSDPMFMNAAALDFRLKLGSPAIDTGKNLLPTVTADVAGVARPQGQAFDIGAYEFRKGGTAGGAGGGGNSGTGGGNSGTGGGNSGTGGGDSGTGGGDSGTGGGDSGTSGGDSGTGGGDSRTGGGSTGGGDEMMPGETGCQTALGVVWGALPLLALFLWRRPTYQRRTRES